MPTRSPLRRALVLPLLAAPALAQQAHVNLDRDPQRNTAGPKPFGAHAISPEVHDDRTATSRATDDWATWRHLLHAKQLPGLWRER